MVTMATIKLHFTSSVWALFHIGITEKKTCKWSMEINKVRS